MCYELESPKFCRHAGLDPASSFIMILKLFWIPAFAGMTLRMNQRQEYQCVKRTLDYRVMNKAIEDHLKIIFKEVCSIYIVPERKPRSGTVLSF